MTSLFLPSVLITLLFFLSGFNKIKEFGQVSKGLTQKTRLPLTISKIVIIIVILLEIIAPFIITVSAYYPSAGIEMYAKLSILGLIIFTVLATLLYHFPPYGTNYYSFMSNLATIGGLMLLYKYY
jgi:uncharacterized membrane protein YphA (DoxX/SURF4 family)